MNENIMQMAAEAAKQLPAGAFLMTGDKPNVMTIGWAQFGIVWGKPVCTVFVRKSRYTHELIEKAATFTVSVPKLGEMKEALGFCGSKSGRSVDKLKELGLETVPSKIDGTPGIKGCAQQFECKLLWKAEGDLTSIADKAVLDRFYKGLTTDAGDPHEVYFGEIVAAYEA